MAVLKSSKLWTPPTCTLKIQIVDPFEKKLNQLSKENIRDLDLQFLARGLGTSSRTFSRRFLNELQVTPGKWIQEKRLEMAQSSLETTRLSVSEICYRVGYQDVASFSRLSARSTGMPPADFRRQIVSQ
jgi:transcriptional regulator GlxA family with amidase domain